MASQQQHTAVMLKEAIIALNVQPHGTYIDLTLGRGGHASAILSQLTTGRLLAFDKDEQAIAETTAKLQTEGSKLQLVHADFMSLDDVLPQYGVKTVNGIIADLGVSSPQLDDASRGFSYAKEARLDMRMNQQQDLDAYVIVNNYDETTLTELLRAGADTPLPKRIATAIVAHRPITTTTQLVDVVRAALPAVIVRKKNPAKMVFQALRIAVNGEIAALQKLVTDAPKWLAIGGSLAIITFHSIEDRIVKHAFGRFVADDTGKLPIIIERKWAVKTVNPSPHEVALNRRARSAKLRVLTRVSS